MQRRHEKPLRYLELHLVKFNQPTIWTRFLAGSKRSARVVRRARCLGPIADLGRDVIPSHPPHGLFRAIPTHARTGTPRRLHHTGTGAVVFPSGSTWDLTLSAQREHEPGFLARVHELMFP